MHNRQKHGNLYHHHHYHNPHHLMDNKNPPGVTSSSSSMDSSASSTSSSSIYTIPGYIAYTLNQNQRGQGGGAMGMPPPTSGPDTHLYSGVSLDNPAFHDVDHKCSPPPPPPPMFSALVRVPLPGIAKNFDIEDETKKPVPPPLALHPAVMAAVAAASPPSPQPTKAPHGFKTWKLRFSKSVKGDRRACAILCVLVSSILLLLGALAVVLYLTVGGGLRLFNKNSGESGEDGISRIQGSFRISNLEFSEDLTNPKSRLYNEIGDEVVAAVDSLFYRSGINDTYNRTELLGFRNGSLTVDVMIFLSSTLPKASETVSSVFIKGLVNMQGTVLLDKFVVDVQSVNFHDLSDKNETISTQRPEKGSNLRVTPSPSVSSSTSKSQYSSTRSTVTASTITIPSTSHKERQQEPQRRPSTTSTTPIPPPSVTVPRAPASGGRGDNSVTSSAFMPPSGSRGRDSAPQPPPPPATINIVTYGTSPRADTLPTWAQWSPWTSCGPDDEPCPSNQTQVRTRECRSRGGTGPALLGTDAEECEKRGGLRFEIRRCPCATQTPRPSTASMGSSSTTPMTTTLFPAKTSPNRPRAPSNFPIPGRTLQSSPSDSAKSYISPKPAPSGAGRPCDDCQEGEICLGKHAEREPTCRPLRDSADQTGCGGWCDLRYEYCQKLATGAFKCIDDRVCLPDEWQCGDGLCIPADKRCDGHFNCYDTTDELNCQCDENHFRCGKNTSCLPLHKRCDRIIDCWDGSDEENCTKRT